MKAAINIFILILLAFSFSVQAAWTYRSGKVEKPVPFTYTIAENTDSPNTDIIYQLHGGGGSDSQLPVWVEGLDAEWKKTGFAAPRFVAVSFITPVEAGNLWVLLNRNQSPLSGLMPFYLNTILPLSETWLTGKLVGKRQVLGFSMGGLNGLLLAIERPELFSKMVLFAPAIFPLSPFATQKEIKAFSDENSIPCELPDGRRPIADFLQLFQQIVPTPADWDKINPATQLASTCERALKAGQSVPSLLISAGDQDTLFFPGSAWLAKVAKGAGYPTTWHPVKGTRHGDVDFAKAAQFLAR